MTRGCDRFLSVRDKEFLAAGFAERSPSGLGLHPAVLVVDAYTKAVGLAREPLMQSIKKWPLSCGLEGWSAIDRTAELLLKTREAGLPTIYSKGLTGFPSPWESRRALEEHSLRSDLTSGKEEEIVDLLTPLRDDLVIEKAAPSCFAGTALDFHLKYLAIDSLIVCGETTSGCVRATVVDAVTLRYRVTVVEDCCFDRLEASHWTSLLDMQLKYADVLPLEHLCRDLVLNSN